MPSHVFTEQNSASCSTATTYSAAPVPSLSTLVCYPSSNLLHDQERLAQYRPGGYHPVCLGDTFKEGRYRVAHKLGWGGFSTVWLARDNLLAQWVALKIATADSTSESRELSTLQSLQRDGASDYIPHLLDSFTHRGPNGVHQCLVSELLGPSVDTVVTDYHTVGDRLEPEIILRISRQLLQALASVHEAGYGHGGEIYSSALERAASADTFILEDVSGANIVFTARNLAHLSEERLFNVIGAPQSSMLARVDGGPLCPSFPKQLVKRVAWEDWIDEDEEDIRLLDWGEAFLHGAEPAKLAQPGDLRAPEVIFTGRFDHRIDLWRAGCTVCTTPVVWSTRCSDVSLPRQIYSLVFAARPFQYLGNEAVLVAQMINFVEELPAEWQTTWQAIQDSSRRSFPTEEATEFKLDCRFRMMVDEPELMPLRPIIQRLTRFLPLKRISAAEALTLL
ncbi:Serine/threonine-protein kinase SRPK [Tolypocladium paradoxum]|uniref:non-specific serine/threonine protein kinase n=1 Tax=Tolypocladium paradoxum TaxID=94208 RepID=A0A2S4L3L8_9HYPO|nr:Serine/threonine-protein kinase SRPK [Tolypocladium paradoxum]